MNLASFLILRLDCTKENLPVNCLHIVTEHSHTEKVSQETVLKYSEMIKYLEVSTQNVYKTKLRQSHSHSLTPSIHRDGQEPSQ